MGQTRVYETVTNERIAAALRRVEGNLSKTARSIGCSVDLIRIRIKNDPSLATLLAQLRQ